MCKDCKEKRKMAAVGQAFTKYVCVNCNEEKMHHNTGVPFVCRECALNAKDNLKYKICQYCAKEIKI